MTWNCPSFRLTPGVGEPTIVEGAGRVAGALAAMKILFKSALLVWLALGGAVGAEMPQYDRSKARPLEAWKPQIAEYSRRHYNEAEWKLEPKCVVLHYTAGRGFPDNLVESAEFAGETPGLASHYVIDGDKVWELLPPTVRSRSAYGINHRAVNIEMIAADATHLYGHRRQTMDTCAALVVQLLANFELSADQVYSHQQVALMDLKVVPWILDVLNPKPYHKIDPGEEPMRYILARVRECI